MSSYVTSIVCLATIVTLAKIMHLSIPWNRGMSHSCAKHCLLSCILSVINKGYTPLKTNDNDVESAVASFAFTYPIVIFDVDISSLVNKISQSFSIASLNWHKQGSPLMERKKQRQLNVHSLNAILSRLWNRVIYAVSICSFQWR